MDEFSFLSVLLSVILGLAITQILQGFRGLLLSRSRIEVYWPVIAWAVLILLVCFQNWWSMFGMRNRHDWTFEQFAMVLLQTILIYMVAGLVFPDFVGEAKVDLREGFYAHRQWFFSLGFASIVVSVLKELVLAGRLPHPTNLAFHAIFGVALLSGVLARRERYHKTLVIFVIATFVLYIFLLYARMR
ncbi:MAG: hypothetical protein ACREIF_19470 [Chthoniobacterales bacterium]